MNELIRQEWAFLTVSMAWGMLLSLIYDGIRIFRRIVIHKKVYIMAAQDILFWIFCGFAIFHVTFMKNDGTIRAFSIAGFVLGTLMYQYAFSRLIVNSVTKLLQILIKPLKKGFKSIKIIRERVKRTAVIFYGKVRNKKRKDRKRKKTKTI